MEKTATEIIKLDLSKLIVKYIDDLISYKRKLSSPSRGYFMAEGSNEPPQELVELFDKIQLKISQLVDAEVFRKEIILKLIESCPTITADKCVAFADDIIKNMYNLKEDNYASTNTKG